MRAETLRSEVAEVLDSLPFWCGVAILTLADVVLFAWQLLPGLGMRTGAWSVAGNPAANRVPRPNVTEDLPSVASAAKRGA